MNPAGYIFMQHFAKESRPVKAFDRWMQRIPREYRTSVLDQLDSAPVQVEADPLQDINPLSCAVAYWLGMTIQQLTEWRSVIVDADLSPIHRRRAAEALRRRDDDWQANEARIRDKMREAQRNRKHVRKTEHMPV